MINFFFILAKRVICDLHTMDLRMKMQLGTVYYL